MRVEKENTEAVSYLSQRKWEETSERKKLRETCKQSVQVYQNKCFPIVPSVKKICRECIKNIDLFWKSNRPYLHTEATWIDHADTITHNLGTALMTNGDKEEERVGRLPERGKRAIYDTYLSLPS